MILRLQNINTRLKSLNRIAFILIITSILYIGAFGFNYVFGFIKGRDLIWFNIPNNEKSIGFIFISTILVAPIFETILGQSLPYYLLKKVKFLNERNYLILLISSLFFGLLHFYSLFYILYAFLLGLVLMYAYIIRIKTDKRTFFLIAICHSLLNIGIFIINLF